MKTLNIIAALATAALVTACSSESEDSAGVGKSEPAFVLNEDTVWSTHHGISPTAVPYLYKWPTGGCTLKEFWELAQSPEAAAMPNKQRIKGFNEYIKSRACHDNFMGYASQNAGRSRQEYMAKQK